MQIQDLLREIERYEEKILELTGIHSTLTDAFGGIELSTQGEIAAAEAEVLAAQEKYVEA